jgi:DNA segregation ATPase FtsK/SpoIIIE, S-DNA-T family
MSTYLPWDSPDDVVDAELVEETVESLPLLPAIPASTEVAIPDRGRLERILMHPAVPVVLTPGRYLPEAAALRRRLAWATMRFLAVELGGAIFAGLRIWVRGWWRWMMLSDEREATILAGTFHQKAEKIRQARVSRFKQTLGMAVVLAVSGLTFWWLAPPEYTAALAVALLLGLFTTGYQWSQPRETVIAAASQMGWSGSVDGIRQALVDAGLMRPDQDVRVVGHPHRVGAGYLTVIDLPPGLTVEKVKAKRAEFASALAADSAFMSLEKAGHDGRLRLWVATDNPFKSGPKRSPLLDAPTWNVWQPAPFGDTPAGREVPLRLMYSNYLGGGKPRSGKTFSARTAVAPYILDPRPRIFCANGKGDAAWAAISQVAVEYINGRSNTSAEQVNAMLDRVIAEMDARFESMSGSRIVEADGLEPWAVIIDEVHLYTANSELTSERVRGKKDAPLGEVIAYKLTDIVKIGPAAGVILFLLTQKPGDTSIPADLRDQMGTRYANKVMTYQTSNQILGNLSPLGYDASRISSEHRGLGILVPDMDEDVLGGLDLDEYPTVRPHLIDDTDFETLCGRGRELRLTAGTLEGQAAGETATGETAGETAGIEDADVVASEIPEVLESIFDFVHGREDGERVASRDLRMRFDPDSNDTAFGLQLRRWGCPAGRDGGRGPSGPRVGDIRAAVARMRGGGSIEVAR